MMMINKHISEKSMVNRLFSIRVIVLPVSILSCLLLFSLLAPSILSSQVVAQAPKYYSQQQLRYYAGYFRYGEAKPYTKPGVYGEILTVDPNVPVGTALYQWVTTIISYAPNLYWVQVGYGEDYFNGRYYYVEKWDDNGWSGIIRFTPGPVQGTWHSYATRRPCDLPWELPRSTDPREWRCYIDNVRKYIFYLTPSVPRDEQAFSESQIEPIRIDGTHFMNLRVYDPANYWYLWQTHIPKKDSPYTLTEVSHYEFYASGGG